MKRQFTHKGFLVKYRYSAPTKAYRVSSMFTGVEQTKFDYKRFKIKAWVKRKIDPANPRKVLINTPDGPTEAILTSRNNAYVAVMLSGDGERGMITESIAKAHNIRAGDWLLTPGRSAKLPVRLRIGAVVSVQPSHGNPNHVIAKVTPAVNLGTLRDIFIVRSLVSQPPPSRGGK